MRARLTVHELEAFLHVADARNFRIASERLHVSQPALTRTVKTMEGKLDVRLFDRNTRRVDLTSAGQELLPIARRIVSEFDSSLSDLSEFVAGQRGSVTIASLPSVAAALLPHAIAEYEQSHPHVVIGLHSLPAERSLALLIDGTADFALSSPPSHDAAGIDYQPLLRDEFVLICGKRDPLARSKKARWSRLTERPFLASGEGTSVRRITDRVLAETGQAIVPRYESSSLALIGAMVAAGLGITAIPRMTLRLLDASELAVVPMEAPPVYRELGVLTRKDRFLSAAVTRFIDVLRRQQGGVA